MEEQKDKQARFTQSPAAVLARLLLGHHSAKTGPLTVTCLATYLNKDKVKLMTTSTTQARFTSEPGMKKGMSFW